MPVIETGRTVTRHFCGECEHAHDDHHRNAGHRCSYEWCPCTRSEAEVKQTEPPVERPTYHVVGVPA